MVRVCIIGCGDVSDQHFQGWAGVDPQVGKLVAVCDVDRARAEAKARRYGIERVFTDYREVLRRDDVDAVDLPLPHYLHAPVGIAAAEAGKHVLVEKPIARTLEEARELLVACRKAGVKLMVSQVTYFSPQMQLVRKIMQAGLLGEIKLAFFRTMHKKDIVAQSAWEKSPWKLTKEGAGGGALERDGIHTTYLLQTLFGSEVKRVYCEADNFLWDTEVDTTAHVMLRYENGIIGELDMSWATMAPEIRDTIVSGTAGSARVTGPGQVQLYSEKAIYAKEGLGEIVAGLTSESLLNQRTTKGYVRPELSGTTVTLHVPPVNARAVLQTHFCAAIANDTEPVISGYDGAKALEIVVGAYRSAETHQAVTLPLIDWQGLKPASARQTVTV